MKGGGGSSFKKVTWGRAKGPRRTTLIGSITVDTVRFQAVGESLPVARIESGCFGKPRGPVVPSRVVETKRKTNPKRRKLAMNFLFDIFIQKV